MSLPRGPRDSQGSQLASCAERPGCTPPHLHQPALPTRPGLGWGGAAAPGPAPRRPHPSPASRQPPGVQRGESRWPRRLRLCSAGKRAARAGPHHGSRGQRAGSKRPLSPVLCPRPQTEEPPGTMRASGSGLCHHLVGHPLSATELRTVGVEGVWCPSGFSLEPRWAQSWGRGGSRACWRGSLCTWPPQAPREGTAFAPECPVLGQWLVNAVAPVASGLGQMR